jgi:hypothetical protein
MSLTHVKELETFARNTVLTDATQNTIAYLLNPNDVTYEKMSISLSAAKNNFSVPGVISSPRILVTFPDGTVVFDTSKSNNTHTNALAKIINENHQSRLAIIAAMLSQSGVGMEKKYSSSTGLFEQALAHRLGKTQQDSVGCIRWSFVA